MRAEYGWFPFFHASKSRAPSVIFPFPVVVLLLASQPRSEIWGPQVAGHSTQQQHDDPEQSGKCWVHAM